METIEATIRSKASTSGQRGTSCFFVPITPTQGIKLYLTPHERDAAWVAQSVGAEHNLAPNTGGCLDIEGLEIPENMAPYWWIEGVKVKTPQTLFGYLTEIVTPLEEEDEEYYEETSSLCDELEDLGFDNIGGDCSGMNLGLTSDGFLVLLDWDARFTTAGLLMRHEVEEIVTLFEGYAYWNRA